jgi:hypothetical protein
MFIPSKKYSSCDILPLKRIPDSPMGVCKQAATTGTSPFAYLFSDIAPVHLR